VRKWVRCKLDLGERRRVVRSYAKGRKNSGSSRGSADLVPPPGRVSQAQRVLSWLRKRHRCKTRKSR